MEAVDALAGSAGVSASDYVLDICSGMGGPARWLAWKSGCRVSGVDLTGSRVAGAKRLTERVNFQHLADFVEGDATALPFPECTFSVAIAQESWCHIPDRAAIISDCARVLKLGGRLAFTDIMTVGELSATDEKTLLSGMRIPRPATLADYKSALNGSDFTLHDATDISGEWKLILVARLAMYRSLKDTTVAKFGEARFKEYDRAYSHFVSLFVDGYLGGHRLLPLAPA